MQVDQRSFPVCIDDPSSRNVGSAYVADLAAEGPRLGLRVFDGAICKIARECADASLERIEVFDYCTALATDTDGVSHHIELFYDDEPLNVNELGILSMLCRPDADRITLVTVGGVTPAGASRLRDSEVTLLRIDADRRTRTVLWHPQ